MKLFTYIRCAVLLLASGLTAMAQPAAAPAKLPSADSILERYVEVTGGKAAYENRKSEITRARVMVPAAGINGTLTIYASAGNQRYLMEIPGIGVVEMGVNGDVAWERSDMLGPRIKEGAERAEAMREASLNSTIRWRDLYDNVAVTGTGEMDGEACYQVKMTPQEGNPITTCYSVESGLALRATTTANSQLGEIPVEIRMYDYKEFGGVLAPSRTAEIAAGQSMEIHIDSTEVNVAIPAERFQLPPDVSALLAP